MLQREQLESILNEAQVMEKMAEDNCEKILEQIKINGFHEAVDKIKNDEIRHQEIVGQLLKLLRSSVD